MKEFNLELAKSGAAVVTRDNRKVRIIAWDRKFSDSAAHSIIGLIEEDEFEFIATFDTHGKTFPMDKASDHDLFMAPVKFSRYAAVNDCGQLINTEMYHDPEIIRKRYPGAIIAVVSWER